MSYSDRPYFNFWNDLEFLWRQTSGSTKIKIAILDGLPDTDHPCLQGALFETYLLDGDHSEEIKASRHGTSVTSLIFANHRSQIKGVAPGSCGMLIPIYQRMQNKMVCSQERLAKAIKLAADKGAHIINVSGGELTPDNQSELVLQEAIDYCDKKNVVIVAAAGNHSCDCVQVPASYPTVLAVGAIDENGVPYEFSNYGELYKSHGVLVPFSDLKVASLHNSYSRTCSTSVSAPIISGVIALLLALQYKWKQAPDPKAVMKAILSGATPCDVIQGVSCDRYLKGILDINKAFRSLFSDNVGKNDLDTEKKNSGANTSVRKNRIETNFIIPNDFHERNTTPALIIGKLKLWSRKISDHVFGQYPVLPEGTCWVLTRDNVPQYAIQLEGAFAQHTHTLYTQLSQQQQEGFINAVAIAGYLVNNFFLIRKGNKIPVFVPDNRAPVLLKRLPPESDVSLSWKENMYSQLSRLLVNTNQSPAGIARNWVLLHFLNELVDNRNKFKVPVALVNIQQERIKYAPKNQSVWQIRIILFNPLRRLEQAQTIREYVVDVTSMWPRLIGRVKEWYQYAQDKIDSYEYMSS